MSAALVSGPNKPSGVTPKKRWRDTTALPREPMVSLGPGLRFPILANSAGVGTVFKGFKEDGRDGGMGVVAL